MPDARLQRTRATLPEGYQFGDAGPRLALHPDAFALAMKPLGLCAPDINQHWWSGRGETLPPAQRCLCGARIWAEAMPSPLGAAIAVQVSDA